MTEITLETQMNDLCDFLYGMGFTGDMQLWCHVIEIDNSGSFSWTLFANYHETQHQLNAQSWYELVCKAKEIICKAKEITGIDLEIREILLAL